VKRLGWRIRVVLIHKCGGCDKEKDQSCGLRRLGTMVGYEDLCV